MPKIGKFWTPIDTSNQQERMEHPKEARLQSFRNGWLKFRNNFLTTKSARILLPKVETNSKDEQLRRCLSRLSEDLSKGRNRQTALSAISKFMTSAGRWDSTVKDLDPAATYIANQLQQLRKNSKLLLKDGDLSDHQRQFLTAIFERVDSDLVVKKGYDHSKLPDPPSPPYVPLSPPDEKGFVEIDLAANTPVPEPELPPAKQPISEQELLDEILSDMTAYKPPPPPADDPPPLPGVKPPDVVVDHAPDQPIDGAPSEQEALENIEQATKADAEIRTPQNPATVVEQKTADKGPVAQKLKPGARVLKHVRNYSDQPKPHSQMRVPERKDSAPQRIGPESSTAQSGAFDLGELEELLDGELQAAQVRAEPMKNESKTEAPRQKPSTKASRRELHKETLSSPTAASTPHWLKGIQVPKDPPSERAEKALEALMITISEQTNAATDIGATYLFHFLNVLANRDLDGSLSKEAIRTAFDKNRPSDEALGYVNAAMASVRGRRDELSKRNPRTDAVLALWDTLVQREPLLARLPSPLSGRVITTLRNTLGSMDLAVPAAAPPAPRPLRREWSQSNT